MTVQPGQREFENLRRLLDMARQEDLGAGDVTGAMLGPLAAATGRLVARDEVVLCGGVFLETICRAYDPLITAQVRVPDGQRADPGTTLGTLNGPAEAVLAAERVVLNFLQHLSGIATETRKYVDAVAGTGAEIYDTRKTVPGWRWLEKYAVRCGGGRNHRMGLHDAVLIKDNHLAVLAGSGGGDPIAALADRFDKVRAKLGPGGFIEIEADTLEQFDAALASGADIIMLDNMSPGEMARAVERRNRPGAGAKVVLEASGRITLDNVRAVAEAGVERIAVGAITHSAPAVDIALDIEVEQ